MSNEVSNQNNNSMLSGLGGSLAFSGIMTGGFGSITAVKNHGTKVFKATKANNDVLNKYRTILEGSGHDVFARNLKTGYNYDALTRLAKQKAKLEKKATKLPIFDRIKNIFRSEDKKITTAAYEGLKDKAVSNYNKAVEALEKGEDISNTITRLDDIEDINKKILDIKETKKLPIKQKIKDLFTGKHTTIDDYVGKLDDKIKDIETSAETIKSAKSLTQSAKSLLKTELKDPMGIFFSATEAFSRFTSEAIPAFKNEGMIAGLKATGKALAAGVANFFTDAGLSVAFRTVGTTIGGFFGPLGASIGSIVGNTVGGFLSNKIIQKIFPTKTPEDKIVQNDEQTQEITLAQAQETTQAQEATQAQEETNAKAKDYSNMPTKEQVRQMAYSQAFPKAASKMNGYYA